MTNVKDEVVDATHKTEHFFGYDAEPGTPKRALGCARFVMFMAAIAFAFLMGSLLGYRWLDIEYDQPGGGDPDIETDVHVGLYWTQRVIPTVNAFTNDEVPLITFEVTDNALFIANSYNTAGNNDGPVEDDEDVNDGAGALIILAVISVLLGFVLIPSAFAAQKEEMGPGCIKAFYGLAGAMLILGAVFSVAGVLVFGGSDLREAFCWRYEVQPSADSGLDDANCNYGASFYAAILGAIFSVVSAILLFALVSPSDIQWVRRADSGKLDAAPAGAAEVSETEKAAAAEAKSKDKPAEQRTAPADSKENPPGTQETSEGEKLAAQVHRDEEEAAAQAAAKRAEEGKGASETEKVAKVQAAEEAGATAPVDAPADSATARTAQA